MAGQACGVPKTAHGIERAWLFWHWCTELRALRGHTHTVGPSIRRGRREIISRWLTFEGYKVTAE